MPTDYTDQAVTNVTDQTTFPTQISVSSITFTDVDDDGVLSAQDGDLLNGDPILEVHNGQSITIDGVKVKGSVFVTEDGLFFTPTDGSVLVDGATATRANIHTQGRGRANFNVSKLGPPCFCAGTRIRTAKGEVMVEEIEVGDLVYTADNGLQPVRWAGKSTIGGMGRFAPIRIKAGTLGNQRDLWVSPQHRILMNGWQLQLSVGEDQALCSAKSLLNDTSITRVPVEFIDYYHIMFDDHQIIYSEGISTESFFMGDYFCCDGSRVRNELNRLYPELEEHPLEHILARRALKSFEARNLTKLL